jgi:hypothetical protein
VSLEVILVKGRSQETALELLSREDEIVQDLFSQLSTIDEPTVVGRAEYGDLSKALIRHIAVREAALVDIWATLEHSEDLPEITERIQQEMEPRRAAFGRVQTMSQGVPRINLNQGQDFAGALVALRNIVLPEIDWELRDMIPHLEHTLSEEDKHRHFHDGDYLLRHAPTRLARRRPRWYETAPIVSRLVALLVNWTDYPTLLRREMRPRMMALARRRRVPGRPRRS